MTIIIIITRGPTNIIIYNKNVKKFNVKTLKHFYIYVQNDLLLMEPLQTANVLPHYERVTLLSPSP